MSKQTRILRLEHPFSLPGPDRAKLAEAAAILRQGGLVAIPTETVYGLAANALDPDAAARIYEAKGRPQDNPLIVHIADMGMLESLAAKIPPSARILAERFWPGPLTMIFPKRGTVPKAVTGGLDTVAVRYPSHPAARELIRLAGFPLAAPSANPSGCPSPTSAQHCIRDLTGRVEAIVDGGSCAVGVESTVITMAETPPRILRPGFVTLEELRSAIGAVDLDPAVIDRLEEGQAAASPGMKYKHYSPRAQVALVDAPEDIFTAYVKGQCVDGVFALVFGPEAASLPCPCEAMGESAEEQARNLFGCLRRLDDRGARMVFARCPAREGVGLAVYNRLIRAAGFDLRTPEGEGSPWS